MPKRWSGRIHRITLPAVAVAVLLVGVVTVLRGSRHAASDAAACPPSDGGAGLQIVECESGRELRVIYGPIELPANASHHEIEQPGARTGTFPSDGWIQGYEVEVVDARGQPVPTTVLHHVNLIMPDRRELFSHIMRRIGAAGHETGAVRLPPLVGLPVEQGQQLLVTAMMHNPTDQDFDSVYVRTRMPFTPRGARIPRLTIHPFYLDVMPPAGKHAYDLPPGRSERRWEGRPAVAGRVLAVGGHLHRYGKLLRLEDVTAGKVLWEARPHLDESGEVVGMPTRVWAWRLGFSLRPDRVYRLTAVYDNPTGEVIPEGGMGALGGAVWLPRGERWPPADPEHPQYARDVEVTYGSSQGHHGHHGPEEPDGQAATGTDERVGGASGQGPDHHH